MSDLTSQLETTTKKRTSVDTEEITLYECPAGCGQHVEEDELVPVRVGEGDEEIETVACEYCARSQYGFDGDASEMSIEDTIAATADSFAERVALPVTRAVLPVLITLGVAGFVFGFILPTAATSFENSVTATTSIFGQMPPLFELPLFFMLPAILWVFLSSAPRI